MNHIFYFKDELSDNFENKANFVIVHDLFFIYRSKSFAASELREGDSYSSGVALISHDITEIPAPRIPPMDVEIPVDVPYVCFDLETTGLGIIICFDQISYRTLSLLGPVTSTSWPTCSKF